MSTEFGGTNIKTNSTDPSRESVDTGKELKAAPDFIRVGDSAVIVRNLYSNDSAALS